MKIPIPVLLSSVAASIFIFTILSFFIVWIGFPTEKPQDSFKDALGFSGGIFAGATTFGAAIVAGFLFNDWKDQHNKEIEIQFISKVVDSYNNFDLKVAKMFQFDYPSLEIALRYDSFIKECSILEFDVRIIQARYNDYYNFLGSEMPKSHKEIFLTLCRSINQLKETNDITEKRKIIQHRISHDLSDFFGEYEKTIHSDLIQNLKALI